MEGEVLPILRFCGTFEEWRDPVVDWILSMENRDRNVSIYEMVTYARFLSEELVHLPGRFVKARFQALE